MTYHNKKINKIIIYIKKTYLYCVVLFWITLYIYFRFFHVRLPYTLSDIKGVIFMNYIYVQIGVIIFHLFLIGYSAYVILCQNKIINNTSSLRYYFNMIIDKLYTIPFKHLQEIIGPRIPWSGQLFCHIATFINKKGFWINKLFVILFAVLPRVIVCIVFFIELVFYNRIYYFIPTLFLLVIPKIWSMILSLFIDFGQRSMSDIESYINIIPVGDPLSNGWHEQYSFEGKDEYDYTIVTVKDYGMLYLLSQDIYIFGSYYMKHFQQQITPYITICLSNMYIFALIYKIYFLVV